MSGAEIGVFYTAGRSWALIGQMCVIKLLLEYFPCEIYRYQHSYLLLIICRIAKTWVFLILPCPGEQFLCFVCYLIKSQCFIKCIPGFAGSCRALMTSNL